MIGDAFRYPVSGDGWLETVLIGSVLTLLSVFLVPVLFINGYAVRVLRAASRDEPLPAFDRWGELLVDGLRWVGVVVVYLFVPTLVLPLIALLGSVGLSAGSEALGVVALVGNLLWIPVFFGGLYLFPAAMTNMAREESFRAAFDTEALWTIATSGTYALAFVVTGAVNAVLGTIAGLLLILLVGAVLAFYVQVVVFYLLGRGAGDALDTADGREPATGTPVAE